MAVWKIQIFDNKADTEPSKSGYVEADTNGDAALAVASAMGTAQLANVDREPRVTKVPPGTIIWIS